MTYKYIDGNDAIILIQHCKLRKIRDKRWHVIMLENVCCEKWENDGEKEKEKKTIYLSMYKLKFWNKSIT
ncbi:unnamed protein product [Brugia timori]|uniref:Uncharacterized protein n=1 Tax=Brugia timori TaxID=42155 RepID=A0A0R3R0T6_9BILA|nr:unnamed protein product [Brugia timori]